MKKSAIKTIKFNIAFPLWMKEDAQICADKKGVNLSEYIRDCVRDGIKKDMKNN